LVQNGPHELLVPEMALRPCTPLKFVICHIGRKGLVFLNKIDAHGTNGKKAEDAHRKGDVSAAPLRGALMGELVREGAIDQSGLGDSQLPFPE
jgi:hypothetical protein